VPRPLFPGVDAPCIRTMVFDRAAANAIRVLRDKDQVDVIGHEHPRLGAHPRFATMTAKQV